MKREVVLGVGMLIAGALLTMAAAAYWRHLSSPRPDPEAEPLAAAIPPDVSAAASAAPQLPPEPPWTAEDDAMATTLEEQREALLRKMKMRLRLRDDHLERMRAIFAASRWLGQGNPEAVEHPMTRAECRQIREQAELVSRWSEVCAAQNMAPLFSRSTGETEVEAKVCIDQFEFPNIACEYPVTWVTAREAALLCRAIDKRLCDAHEWEGACAGDLREPQQEYAFGKERPEMQRIHNANRAIVWAYGPTKDHSRCGTGSRKSRACTAIGWKQCGSNTYPAGAFPQCASPFGVFDLHGNAAEHMNLPLRPEQLASAGGMGQTEMKGSWFIFASYAAHIDDCRWRAPSWHESRVMDPNSHQNYHLGFRCCKDLTAQAAATPGAGGAVP